MIIKNVGHSVHSTSSAAIYGVLASIPIAMYFKIGSKGWVDSELFVDLPFLHQMGITALLTLGIIMLLSYRQNKGANDPKGIELQKNIFKTSPTFNVGAFAVMLVLIALYALLWS